MVCFISIKILIEYSVANPGEQDQKLHSAASELGMHYLPMSHKKDAGVKWVILYGPQRKPVFGGLRTT